VEAVLVDNDGCDVVPSVADAIGDKNIIKHLKGIANRHHADRQKVSVAVLETAERRLVWSQISIFFKIQ
jgi:hypothetical protein